MVTVRPFNETIPPPSHLQQGELTNAELAQLHIPTKRSFFSIRSSKSKVRGTVSDDANRRMERTASSHRETNSPRFSTETGDSSLIKIGNHAAYIDEFMENYHKDVYRWAVLYENQRGATFFSTPYYSRLSLLPIDPPAFTLPSTTKLSPRTQSSLDLSTYPLPDGSWRWVSREWMVDMRGDGQTQYDGFEYNWHFRTKHWRPQVGLFSSGGWVRRRRWVRLMVRPAVVHEPASGVTSVAASPLLAGIVPRVEVGVTRPPSVMATSDNDEYDSDIGEDDTELVWKGVLEEDWQRCRRALMRLDRDGRKLEIWHRWLRELLPAGDSLATQSVSIMTPPPKKQWTEDSNFMSSQHVHDTTDVVDKRLVQETGVSTGPAAREHIVDVLRVHCQEIFRLFIYPESRTQFLALLAGANLLPDLGFGPCCSLPSMHDFWSSSQSLHNILFFSPGP